MTDRKKLLGEERREKLLSLLQTSAQPITGSALSKMTNVSRQVIVSDITLLKARNEPIVATSQGYIYLQTKKPIMHERTVACNHDPSLTEIELNLLVDLGIMVKDVKVEHPVYGDLTASIMVTNRKEVQQFLEKVTKTKAAYLSELTNGIHLHTIAASSEELLNEAEAALKKANILID
ncbi:transcription repressor NadR [Bacillus cihuensis]|uniref:transcription repressor NadR n=1 Tax=Bacillus cihuensis TaxID=1208599 RepID=UPI000421FE6C|nr:transcription repressor NadR [Bacillus cihuensis]